MLSSSAGCFLLCALVCTLSLRPCLFFFFFNDTATTEIYTLSLHDALPIYPAHPSLRLERLRSDHRFWCVRVTRDYRAVARSEEHTSELQSPCNLVCRLLLEKKKKHTQSRSADQAYTPHLCTTLNSTYAARL